MAGSISYFKDSRFRIFDFLVLLVIIMISSKIMFFISLLQVVKLVGSFLGFFVLAELATARVSFISLIPPVIQTVIKVLIGGFIYGTLQFVFKSHAVEYLLYTAGLLGLVFIKKDFSIDTFGILTILPFFLILLNKEEVYLGSEDHYRYTFSDYFYYTSLTESIAYNWNINDAIWHKGVPINYQCLTFIFPASLCYNLKIQGHLALMSFTIPLLKIFSFGVVSSSIYFLLSKMGVEIKRRNLTAFLLSVSLMLLAPINYVYLLKLDFKNLIFLGEGYVLPMGSPGFALGFLLFGVTNYYFFNPPSHQSWYEGFLFALFVGAITAIKFAFAVPLLCFYGFVLVLRSVYNRTIIIREYLPLIVAAVLSLVFYLVFFGQGAGMTKGSLTMHGYLPEMFGKTAEKYHLPQNTLVYATILLYMIILWMGLKLLLTVFLFIKEYRFSREVKIIILSAFLAAVISALPAFFVKVALVDEAGKLLQDGTFDMAQFLRGGIFIMNAFSVIIIGYLFLHYSNKWYHKSIKVITIGWFALTAMSFMYLMAYEPKNGEVAWYDDVVNELKTAKPKLPAMLSQKAYSGTVLCAKGVFPWWTCVKRGDASGYAFTTRSNYRNHLLESVLDPAQDLGTKKAAAEQMKNEGVDILVATPATLTAMKEASKATLLTPVKDSEWLFSLN